MTHPGEWRYSVALASLAMIGALISGVMLIEHGGGWLAEPQGTGFLLRLCDPVGGTGEHCADVVGSSWGEFDLYYHGRRLVFPTSYFGLAYFLTAAIWFGIVFRGQSAGRLLRGASWCLIVGGLAASVTLLIAMVFLLGQWCALCGAVHWINAVIVATAARWLWATRRPSGHTPGASHEDAPIARSLKRRFALSSAVALVAVVSASWLYFDAMNEARRQWRKARGYADAVEALQSDSDLMLMAYRAQPVVDPPGGEVASGGGDAALGSGVTLFVDYDSGASACFEKRWNLRIRPLLPASTAVRRRSIPSGSAGSVAARVSDPGVDFDAALAAEAALAMGGEVAFERMRRLLFSGRHDPSGRDYAELASKVGLNVGQFRATMAHGAARDKVVQDVRLAVAYGVRESPGVVLNGRRVPDICMRSEAFWRAIGDEMLSAGPTEPGPGALTAATELPREARIE